MKLLWLKTFKDADSPTFSLIAQGATIGLGSETASTRKRRNHRGLTYFSLWRALTTENTSNTSRPICYTRNFVKNVTINCNICWDGHSYVLRLLSGPSNTQYFLWRSMNICCIIQSKTCIKENRNTNKCFIHHFQRETTLKATWFFLHI